jgi:hypothetical protein
MYIKTDIIYGTHTVSPLRSILMWSSHSFPILQVNVFKEIHCQTSAVIAFLKLLGNLYRPKSRSSSLCVDNDDHRAGNTLSECTKRVRVFPPHMSYRLCIVSAWLQNSAFCLACTIHAVCQSTPCDKLLKKSDTGFNCRLLSHHLPQVCNMVEWACSHTSRLSEAIRNHTFCFFARAAFEWGPDEGADCGRLAKA